MSPPTSEGTSFTEITGTHEPGRWRRDVRTPCLRRPVTQGSPLGGGRIEVLPGRATWAQLACDRYPFPSRTKRSDRSVRRAAMTWALRASGNTFGQSLNGRLVVTMVERRWS